MTARLSTQVKERSVVQDTEELWAGFVRQLLI